VTRAPAAGEVDLERVPGRVIAVAHELDGEIESGPVAVNLVAAAIDVRPRPRQRVPFEQREEAAFERAERDIAVASSCSVVIRPR
jgi:hypothetical protein